MICSILQINTLISSSQTSSSCPSYLSPSVLLYWLEYLHVAWQPSTLLYWKGPKLPHSYLYVLALFGTHQLQYCSQTGGILFYTGVVNLLLITSIDFIAYDCQHNVLRSIRLQLLHPFFHHFVWPLGGDVVYAEGNASFTIIDGSDRAVLFLSSCVPDLLGERSTWN